MTIEATVAPHLLVARSYIGQCEEPPGSNYGPPGNIAVRSLACVGIAKPASWCAAYGCLCIYEAYDGFPEWFQPSASALRLRALNAKCIVSRDLPPEPGDYAIYDHGGGLGHQDIVSSVTVVQGHPGYAYVAVGGNTSHGGSRQGIGVFECFRDWMNPQLVCFLRFPWRGI